MKKDSRMNATTLELVLDADRLQHSLGREDRLGPPSSHFGGSSRSSLPFNLLISGYTPPHEKS